MEQGLGLVFGALAPTLAEDQSNLWAESCTFLLHRALHTAAALYGTRRGEITFLCAYIISKCETGSGICGKFAMMEVLECSACRCILLVLYIVNHVCVILRSTMQITFLPSPKNFLFCSKEKILYEEDTLKSMETEEENKDSSSSSSEEEEAEDEVSESDAEKESGKTSYSLGFHSLA